MATMAAGRRVVGESVAAGTALLYEIRRAELMHDYLSRQTVCRITYRPRETRRWWSFYLVPDEGETVQAFGAKILPAVHAHAGLKP